MTPCEEAGYKVGDEFEVLKDREGFKKGQIVTLYQDDGSADPLFAGDNKKYDHANGAPGAYMWFGNVRKIDKNR